MNPRQIGAFVGLVTLFALCLWTAEVPSASAHSGRTFSAFGTPPDWSAAYCGSLPLPGHGGVVCVMNDATNLYIGLFAIPDLVVTADDPRDGWVLFDDDHDGFSEAKEDGLRIKFAGVTDFRDTYRIDAPPLGTWNADGDITAGGTNDGSGATWVMIPPPGLRTWPTMTYFQFTHPLASSDPTYDFTVGCSPSFPFFPPPLLPNVIGANWGAQGFLPGGITGGFAYNVDDASTWDDIRIACAGDPPRFPAGDMAARLVKDISGLPDSAFKNGNGELRGALGSKMDEVAGMLVAGNFRPAANKLANDILPKLNPAAKHCWLCAIGPGCYQAGLELLAEINAVLGVSPEPS